MTHDDAIRNLRDGASMYDMAEALITLCENSETKPEEIMLGLLHKGFVQEQAAFALYRRTKRPLPDDRDKLDMTVEGWRAWLVQNGIDTSSLLTQASRDPSAARIAQRKQG